MAWLAKRSRPRADWHHILLSPRQVAAHEHERLKLVFGALYMASHMPAGMRLWVAARADGGADAYISPQAVAYTPDLLAYYQGAPCAEPAFDGPVAAAGDAEAPPVGLRLVRRRVEPRHRSFAPVPYSYRSMKGFHAGPGAAQLLLISGQVAPYLRRYIKAWFR